MNSNTQEHMMNERIAELLAKLDIDLYTDKGVMMTKILVSPKDLRQFAELIVRECLAQVARVDDMLEDEPAQTAAVAWVASSIAQHFGVEE